MVASLDVTQYMYLFGECSDEEISAYFGFGTAEELQAEREKYDKGVVTYNRHFHHFFVGAQGNRPSDRQLRVTTLGTFTTTAPEWAIPSTTKPTKTKAIWVKP